MPKQKVADKSEEKPESVLNMKKIFGLIFAPGVTMLLLIKLICGIPIGIIQSMFSVIAIEQFGMPAEQVTISIITRQQCKVIYSRLSSSLSARGSCTSLVTVGPTKV